MNFSSKRIVLIVIMIHLMGVLFFSLGTKKEMSPKKLVVHTHTMVKKPQKVEVMAKPQKVVAMAKPIVKTTPPQKVVAAPPKKVVPVLKKAPPKPKIEKSDAHRDQLKEILKQNLKRLNATDKHLTDSASERAPRTPLCVESIPCYTPTEKDYQEEIASYLEQALQLPVRGEVDLKLTLSRLGEVIGVEISHTSSDENASFVTHEIPLLSFPPFGPFFKNKTSHTFSLKLKT